MNKLFPIVLALMCFGFSQSDFSSSSDSAKEVGNLITSSKVTESMIKNAEKGRRTMILNQVIVGIISLCVILGGIGVIIYFKRKRDEKLEEEIKKNEKFRKLEKRLNKLETK